MNLGKAIHLSVLVYVVPFFAALTASMAIGGAPEMSSAVGLVGIGATILMLILLSLSYFKEVKPSAAEGFKFGIVAGVVGTAIDTVTTIIMDPSRYIGNLDNPMFWGAFAMVVAISTIVGALSGRGKKQAASPAKKSKRKSKSSKKSKK